ncbi:MAG: electron transfer flavoprotein subunit beta/FixA family protein [Firmicutes bacterium]|nr:electron transfer flavoprotein subunit beta/FixA family protein [Bacillota bacterium]
MKIIVCIKQVPATNEVRLDPVTNTIIREGIESITNPFDTYAIEEAIRLKKKLGWQTAALSMGIPAVKEILRDAMALGIDEAYLLSDRGFAGADTLATAYALAGGVQKVGGAQLIICGKMATDGDTAQVGPMLAEMLGVPHITDVAEIISIDEKEMVCRKLTDDGYQEVKMQLPALITVNKEINVPGLPSMQGILNTYDAPVTTYTVPDLDVAPELLGLAGSPTQVVRTFIPNLTIDNEWLTGTVNQQADALLNRLSEHNIIEKEG